MEKMPELQPVINNIEQYFLSLDVIEALEGEYVFEMATHEDDDVVIKSTN